MWKLIWNNIARRKNQSLLTIAITMLTILSFVLVLGVFVALGQGLELSKQRLGADVIFLPEDVEADGYELLFTAQPETHYMDISVYEQIAALEEVAQASPQFYSQTIGGESCCDLGESMRVVGVDMDTDFILTPYFNLQQFDSLENDQMILGGNFTDYMGKTMMVLNQRFTVVGELYPTGTGMDDTIFMNMEKARELTYQSPFFSEIWADRDINSSISAVMVKVKDGVDAEKFADSLCRYSDLPIVYVSAGGTVSALQSQLEATMKVLLALWIISLLIAALALFGRFNAIAKDRKKEIGLMRAIGFQKTQVFQLVIGEACVMAAIGGAVGSLLACLCMNSAIAMLEKVFMLPNSVWNVGSVIVCFAAGAILSVVIGFLAALYPAVKSAKMEPQAAITQGDL